MLGVFDESDTTFDGSITPCAVPACDVFGKARQLGVTFDGQAKCFSMDTEGFSELAKAINLATSDRGADQF